MSVSIFLSHNFRDKPFARRLARDLENQRIGFWLDEAEIKVGQSLIEKIREGIDKVDYVAVILSPDSVDSAWVQREVDVAMNQEISGRRVKVLPIMYRKCEPPGFLLGKRYADFTDESKYSAALEDLVSSVGIVFNRSALMPPNPDVNLGYATDKAWSLGMPMLSKPFYRPFQYLGMSVESAAKAVGMTPNPVGNIIIDTDDCCMLLEAEGNFISYIDIELKQTAPHYQNIDFDSEAVLGALSINPTELDLVRKKTHYHTYYDHRKRLKISVACIYDGGPLSVGFSSKYYGM
jgi:hypothetical protein